MTATSISNPLELAGQHRIVMRLAALRIGAGLVFTTIGDTMKIPSLLPWVLSLAVGAAMACFGYRCCCQLYDPMLSAIAALFLVVPGGWLLAMLIVNGNIGDSLYKHCGSVGFFGATDEQIEKLKSTLSADAGDTSTQ